MERRLRWLRLRLWSGQPVRRRSSSRSGCAGAWSRPWSGRPAASRTVPWSAGPAALRTGRRSAPGRSRMCRRVRGSRPFLRPQKSGSRTERAGASAARGKKRHPGTRPRSRDNGQPVEPELLWAEKTEETGEAGARHSAAAPGPSGRRQGRSPSGQGNQEPPAQPERQGGERSAAAQNPAQGPETHRPGQSRLPAAAAASVKETGAPAVHPRQADRSGEAVPGEHRRRDGAHLHHGAGPAGGRPRTGGGAEFAPGQPAGPHGS